MKYIIKCGLLKILDTLNGVMFDRLRQILYKKTRLFGILACSELG